MRGLLFHLNSKSATICVVDLRVFSMAENGGLVRGNRIIAQRFETERICMSEVRPRNTRSGHCCRAADAWSGEGRSHTCGLRFSKVVKRNGWPKKHDERSDTSVSEPHYQPLIRSWLCCPPLFNKRQIVATRRLPALCHYRLIAGQYTAEIERPPGGGLSEIPTGIFQWSLKHRVFRDDLNRKEAG